MGGFLFLYKERFAPDFVDVAAANVDDAAADEPEGGKLLVVFGLAGQIRDQESQRIKFPFSSHSKTKPLLLLGSSGQST